MQTSERTPAGPLEPLLKLRPQKQLDELELDQAPESRRLLRLTAVRGDSSA